jgi:hypothetical protein
MKYIRIPWKYKVAEGFAYRLKCSYTIAEPFANDYFGLSMDGWLLIYKTYAWDGATKFPDFDWIKTPSAIHDALHEAIRLGAIPEAENDLIDKELELAIEGNPAVCWLKRQMLRLRGTYVRNATHWVDEEAGSTPKVYTVPPIEGEITLDEYWRQRREYRREQSL